MLSLFKKSGECDFCKLNKKITNYKYSENLTKNVCDDCITKNPVLKNIIKTWNK